MGTSRGTVQQVARYRGPPCRRRGAAAGAVVGTLCSRRLKLALIPSRRHARCASCTPTLSRILHVSHAPAIEAEFAKHIRAESFPCLAAKGVFNSGGHDVHVYGELISLRSARRMASDLRRFATDSRATEGWMKSFVAIFPHHAPENEETFERGMWTLLQNLHDCEPADSSWDASVSSDPAEADFSFSFAGVAMFVVGMHAASSRLARRFQHPAIVFNPRAQFDRLRANGRFERLRAVVRDREVALQGSINPNLADFGEASDARQYSGRATESEWQCPFRPRPLQLNP